MRPRFLPIESLFLLLLLAFIAAMLNYSHVTDRLDNAIYDMHLNLWPRPPSEDIILVVIDEQSLGELGRWPWPRRFHAKLLDVLKDSKAVGLDIIFAEPDENDPEGDQALVDALSRNGRVVLPVSPMLATTGGSVEELQELSSLPDFNQAAAAIGHVDVELDQDGISRSLFLKAGIGSPDRPALPLAMLQIEGRGELVGERRPDSDKNTETTWVRDYRVLLPFSDTVGYFQKVSFIDALDQAPDSDFFKDKWVLVGIDAIGLGDRIATPVTRSDQPMAGVEFEAHALDALLNRLTIIPLNDLDNLLLTVPFIVLLGLVFFLFKTDRILLTTSLSVTSILLFSVLLARTELFGGHYWFRPGPAIVATLVGFLILYRNQLRTYVSSLTREKSHAEVAMNTVSDAVVITDSAGRIEFMNPQAETLTGHLLKNVRGRPLSEVMAIQDAKGSPYPIDMVAKSQATNTKVELPLNHFLRQRDGHLLPLRASAKPFEDENRNITGVIVAFDELRTHDPEGRETVIDELTRLPGRSLLFDRLNHAISNANRTKRLVAVLYIDLDEFDKINDAFGKQNGDALLREIAKRLVLRGRAEDTIARYSGDHFIVILENLEDTDPVAAVATSLLEVIRQPARLGEHEISIEASIGISIYPKDGMDSETLINNAHTAMKRAKKSRRHDLPRFRFYSQKMNKGALERLLSEKDLRNALTENRFVLHYQPRVDFNTGKIVAMEALIRWKRAGEGLILPTSFIPLAERSGLISDIGTWVLRTACQQAKKWNQMGQNMRMAINLSPRQFMQHDLLDTITRILDDEDLDPNCLELEITENSLVRDADRCIEILKEFRMLGGTVSIDDFGTGYSSLSYLKNFPVDILKIDKVFTRDITTEPDHAAITLAVISLAHSLSLRVVAEGVEEQAQFDFLRSRGCDELQGFYFSKPLPANEITEMLNEGWCLEVESESGNPATTLLLVDDDDEMLSHMGVMLRDQGYRILMASSGEEALNMMARHNVGVVVSDEVMPGMRGSELLEKIKSLYPMTTRILLSANADRDAIISAINSGAIFKFLNKPISETDLINTLREAFNLYINNRNPV